MDVLELLRLMKEELDIDSELNFTYGTPSNAYISGEYNMIRIAERYVNSQVEKMAKEDK